MDHFFVNKRKKKQYLQNENVLFFCDVSRTSRDGELTMVPFDSKERFLSKTQGFDPFVSSTSSETEEKHFHPWTVIFLVSPEVSGQKGLLCNVWGRLLPLLSF